MATLFNTKIKDTYQSLLKLEDNTILTTTVKNVTDGLGNASPLYMSTTQVRIGSTSGSAMYWDNVNNRLGIGTSSPTQALSVNGTITANGLSLSGALQGTGTGDNYLKGSAFTIQSAVNNTDNSFYISTASLLERKVLFLAKNLGSYGRSDLYLCINGDNTATNASITDSKVLFKANGNVLIGTTTDAGYKLDVNGSTRVKGNSLTISASGLTSVPAEYIALNFDNAPNHHQNWFAIRSIKDIQGVVNGYDRIIFPTMGSNNSTWDFNALGTYSAISISSASSGNNLNLNNTSITFNGNFKVVTMDTANRKLVYGNTTTDAHHLPVYDLVIKGAQPFEGNTGGSNANGGNVYVVGGTPSTSPAGNYGNVILAHDGTAARGNVGIGTITPAERLDLVGNFKLSGNIVLGDATGGSGGGFQVYKNSNVYTYSLVHSQSHHIYLFANPQGSIFDGFPAQSTGIRTLGKLLFMPDGATAVTMLTNGNVLIGTTTDGGQKLQVNGSILASSLNLSQGTATAGQYDLVYPNHIRYQSAYHLNIVPKDNTGTTVTTGGTINIAADTINLLHTSQFSMFSGTLFNGGDRVTLKKGGSHYMGAYLAIEGADAPSYNYGTRSGSVLIYPGEETHGNGLGNVILAHTGTAARGSVIVGGTTINDSAILNVQSTTKGFLPPRMTSTQRNAIATPATGLQVFDTTQNAICEYTGTAWRTVSGGKQVINAITGATTLDLSLGNVADVTLTLSTVLTLSNPTVGTYVIKLIQDAIGGKTVSWPFNVLWSGSTPPTLTATANRTDVITLLYDGVNFYGTYALNF